MKPLTKSQGDMLRRVASFDQGCPLRCGVLFAPLRRLLHRGLIEFYEPRKIGGWRFVRLTNAGRAALHKFAHKNG